MIAGQYFAGSFLENELAQSLRTILESNKLESVKRLQKLGYRTLWIFGFATF
jgi:hypothetical protein